MTTFLLLLKYFFWSVLCTLLQVVFLSVTKLLLEYNFRVLFTPLKISQRGLIFSCFGMHVFQRPMLFANLYGAEIDLTSSIDQSSLYLVGLTFNE